MCEFPDTFFVSQNTSRLLLRIGIDQLIITFSLLSLYLCTSLKDTTQTMHYILPWRQICIDLHHCWNLGFTNKNEVLF